MASALAARYRARSLWLDGLDEPLAPRPALGGHVDCDIAIVGGGFTGLWTAYYLARRQPGLRIRVLEAEICGYGSSGRNAGFVSAGIAGEARVYARRGGLDAVRRAERAIIDTVDEIGSVVAHEGIACGWRKGGSFRLALTLPQLARVDGGIRARRERGWGEEDVRRVEPAEVARHVALEGVLGGTYTPHCARVDPARLARGLARVCERYGVVIHEGSPVVRLEPNRALLVDGLSVRAGVVVRATESYTTRLPGEARSFLPLRSHMLATEPLPAQVWEAIGWQDAATIADQRYHFMYLQRTRDDRIACGGLGTSYSLGGAIRERDEADRVIHARLEAELRRRFPALGEARITHRWGGAFAAPRDWSMGIGHDPARGMAWSGGYSGHGLSATNLGGRTLADLILGVESELTSLPFVGHRSPRWEPEPLRFIGSWLISSVLAGADRSEEATGRAARRVRLVSRFVPGR